MADSATGGPGADRTYIVHYRRKDGTGASGQAEPNAWGGFSWLVPEDCAAITGVEEIGGGGGSSAGTVYDGPPLPFCGVPGHPDGAHGGHPEPAYSEYRSVLAVRDAQLAEKDAEIARLTAELDATRNVPVEYVITAGLEAAMAADPHREDGMILRTTDGKREAWAWRAAAKTWEQVT